MLENHALIGLRDVRKHRGVRVREAASMLGVNESSYVRYENGTRRLYADQLFVLANLLRCSAEDLHTYRQPHELVQVLGPAGRDDPRPALQDEAPAPPVASVPPPPVDDAGELGQALEGWQL